MAAVFDDQGVSGSLARERRPAMKALLRAVTRREVDMVAAWAVDRLGRSLVDLLGWRTLTAASSSGRRGALKGVRAPDSLFSISFASGAGKFAAHHSAGGTPHGPVRRQWRCWRIQSQPASFSNSVRSRPRAAR